MIDDNVTVTILVVGTFILMLVASFTISVVFAYQKKYYKHLQEVNTIRETYEQELLKTQLEIREQTMQNISLEIHDNIGQVLSLANLQLTSIDLDGNPVATRKIERTMELVSKAIHDLRNLSRTLNAENIVKAGLKTAIELDLELIEKSGIFATAMSSDGDERRLDQSKEIIVYRIIQETLNNIMKHSRASAITINLNYAESALYISIADDGKGFTKIGNDPGNKPGEGLRNMMNRAQLISASLTIASEPDKGTTVKLCVPYTHSNK